MCRCIFDDLWKGGTDHATARMTNALQAGGAVLEELVWQIREHNGLLIE
jgi:hypothetical protein